MEAVYHDHEYVSDFEACAECVLAAEDSRRRFKAQYALDMAAMHGVPTATAPQFAHVIVAYKGGEVDGVAMYASLLTAAEEDEVLDALAIMDANGG